MTTIIDPKLDMQDAIEEGKQGAEAYANQRFATIFHNPATPANVTYELTRAFTAGANWGYQRAVNEMHELLQRSRKEADEQDPTLAEFGGIVGATLRTN